MPGHATMGFTAVTLIANCLIKYELFIYGYNF